MSTTIEREKGHQEEHVLSQAEQSWMMTFDPDCEPVDRADERELAESLLADVHAPLLSDDEKKAAIREGFKQARGNYA